VKAYLALIIVSLLLPGCDANDQAAAGQQISAAEILAGDGVAGYLRAEAPRTFSFPADHGPHPGYRNEWWYLTGNLETLEGRRFGYQVTFFSSAIRPQGENECGPDTTWCSNHIWMGHAALSDVQEASHHADEIFSRQEPALAGAKLDPFRVWIQDWQLFSTGNGFPWELEILADGFALTLSLSPLKQPVLQGDRGLSQKSPEPGNASYYYSLTRIDTSGQVRVNGETYSVSGSSWLDREWSTSALASDQSGWDWFSLQLEDGSELMYYQLRDLAGNAHPNSSGSMTSIMGTQTRVSPEQVRLTPISDWQAPDGTVYTTQWRMQAGENDWIIRSAFDDQLMDVTFQYWEGAVEVLDAGSEVTLGRGYLEMVR